LILFIKFHQTNRPKYNEDNIMLADQTQTDALFLTPAAAQAIKELVAKRDLEGYALRVYVSGGGCSGMQYGMALDNEIREMDITCESDGVKAVVDEVSIQYLRGATIDFVDDLMGSGFKIDNPNAVAGCGCGSSFRTTDEAAAQENSGGCNSCG
jgi:iron-sulfur cluster assembly accessory protein